MCGQCHHADCAMEPFHISQLDEIISLMEHMETALCDAKAELAETVLRVKESVKQRFLAMLEESIDRAFEDLLKGSQLEVYLRVFERVNDLKSEFDLDEADSRKKNQLVKWLRLATGLARCEHFESMLSKGQIEAKLEEYRTKLDSLCEQNRKHLAHHEGWLKCLSVGELLKKNNTFGQEVRPDQIATCEAESPPPKQSQPELTDFYGLLTTFKPLRADTRKLTVILSRQTAPRRGFFDSNRHAQLLFLDDQFMIRKVDRVFSQQQNGNLFKTSKLVATGCLEFHDCRPEPAQVFSVRLDEAEQVERVSACAYKTYFCVELTTAQVRLYQRLPTNDGFVVFEIFADRLSSLRKPRFARAGGQTVLAGVDDQNLFCVFDLRTRALRTRLEDVQIQAFDVLESDKVCAVSMTNSLVVVDLAQGTVVADFVVRVDSGSIGQEPDCREGHTTHGQSGPSKKKDQENEQKSLFGNANSLFPTPGRPKGGQFAFLQNTPGRGSPFNPPTSNPSLGQKTQKPSLFGNTGRHQGRSTNIFQNPDSQPDSSTLFDPNLARDTAGDNRCDALAGSVFQRIRAIPGKRLVQIYFKRSDSERFFRVDLAYSTQLGGFQISQTGTETVPPDELPWASEFQFKRVGDLSWGIRGVPKSADASILRVTRLEPQSSANESILGSRSVLKCSLKSRHESSSGDITIKTFRCKDLVIFEHEAERFYVRLY